MPDETVITTPAKVDPEKPLLEEIREKSFHQILREQKEAQDKAAAETPAKVEEPKKEEEDKAVKEAEEAKKRVEEEEAAKKRDEEIAQKAAADVIAKQKTEEEVKQKELQKEEDEKKRQEALKPNFTGKDKDGNPVPKNYEEIAAESARIAKEEAKQEVLAELQAKEEAKQEEQDQITKQAEDKKATQKAFEDQLQKELDQDLSDLYTQGKLPKVKDEKDPNDPGNKEFKNLFETAQRVNAERIAKGEPPIRSIKLIFYEHYKPLDSKVPGHDAPVLGSESTISQEPPEDKYIPSRDRNKSMEQLIKEEASRLAKRFNIRGK